MLHVAPEAAVGGPLALVRDGDMIELDIAGAPADLQVDDAELAERREAVDAAAARFRAATAGCSPSTSRRPTKAATSTFSERGRHPRARNPLSLCGRDAMDLPDQHVQARDQGRPLADRPVVQPRQPHLGRDPGRLGLRLAAARHRAFAERAADGLQPAAGGCVGRTRRTRSCARPGTTW